MWRKGQGGWGGTVVRRRLIIWRSCEVVFWVVLICLYSK